MHPIIACTGADAGVQSEEKLGRRSVGAMDAKAPPEPVALAANGGTVLGDLRGVIGPPILGPSRSDASAVFRLDEFDPSPIGKRLLRRIHDLDNMALGTVAGELGDRAAHVGDITP